LPFEGFGVVKLLIGVRHEDGDESIRGLALVALPYTDGPSVPYPFRPSETVKVAEEE
jgi:hypothetical protein